MMSLIKEKRCGNVTVEQKRELISFIEEHPELKSGKFSAEFTFKKAQSLWQEVTVVLDTLPGAKKDWKQWRKAWQDVKGSTKKKNSIIINHCRGTGGGGVNIHLTAEDKKVVDIIGPILTEGHPTISESNCHFEMENEAADEVLVWDHDYFESAPEMIDAEPSTSSENMPVKPATNTKIADASVSNTPLNRRKNVRVQRLENSVSANDTLIRLTEKKMQQKDEYYSEKLQLYKREVEAKERDVEAKRKISETLEKLLKKFKD